MDEAPGVAAPLLFSWPLPYSTAPRIARPVDIWDVNIYKYEYICSDYWLYIWREGLEHTLGDGELSVD
jgi:hypothetical protein